MKNTKLNVQVRGSGNTQWHLVLFVSHLTRDVWKKNPKLCEQLMLSIQAHSLTFLIWYIFHHGYMVLKTIEGKDIAAST